MFLVGHAFKIVSLTIIFPFYLFFNVQRSLTKNCNFMKKIHLPARYHPRIEFLNSIIHLLRQQLRLFVPTAQRNISFKVHFLYKNTLSFCHQIFLMIYMYIFLNIVTLNINMLWRLCLSIFYLLVLVFCDVFL